MIPKLLCLGLVLGQDDADTVRAPGIIDRAESQDLSLLPSADQ
jgi:hypothetical protein